MIYFKTISTEAKKGQKIRNSNNRIRDSKRGRNQSISVGCRLAVSKRRSTYLLVRQSVSVGCRFKRKKPSYRERESVFAAEREADCEKERASLRVREKQTVNERERCYREIDHERERERCFREIAREREREELS